MLHTVYLFYVVCYMYIMIIRIALSLHVNILYNKQKEEFRWQHYTFHVIKKGLISLY